MIPGFPVPERESGSFIKEAMNRPDSFDRTTLDSAERRGVIQMDLHAKTYGSMDLREYRPEKPKRFQLEGVESLMYETDFELLTKYGKLASERFPYTGHTILDIGTFHGCSAITMAWASKFDVVTLDPYPGPNILESFKHHGVAEQVYPVKIKSEDYLWPPGTKIPLMMIDGLHLLTQVKFEFYYFGQHVPVGGFVAFHDVGKAKWTGICDVINEAVLTPHWRIADLEGYMCVLERL